MRSLAEHLQDSGLDAEKLAATAKVESRTLKLILAGSYTPSPSERQRLAAAVGVPVDEIAWGHTIAVQHLRGNGPQSGRST
jgi:hypothetical protein